MPTLARYELYDNQTLESHVRGLTTQHSQELDSAFSPELTEHLFQQQGESFGLDLVGSSYCSYYSDKCNSGDLLLTLGEPQHPARAGPRPGAIQQLADTVWTAEVGQSIVKQTRDPVLCAAGWSPGRCCPRSSPP